MHGGKYDPAKLRFPMNLLAGKVPASDLRGWTVIRAWAADLKPILTEGVAMTHTNNQPHDETA